jgi:hypothetical protein
MLQRPQREVGMLSKTLPVAITALTALVFTSCISLPWSAEAPANEVNLAFTIQNNLLFLTTAEINNKPGRIFFGSAHPKTILDPAFAEQVRGGGYTLDLNQRDTLPFTPVITPLGGVGDALVGADVWGGHAVTINYRSGLLTYQKDGIYPAYMTLYRFDAEPKIVAEVDGKQVPVVVDTALPDTLVLPRGTSPAGRRTARVAVAGTDFGTVDVALADVSQARIGNRLLSKFLISVDYGRHQIGLWRDPRIPL